MPPWPQPLKWRQRIKRIKEPLEIAGDRPQNATLKLTLRGQSYALLADIFTGIAEAEAICTLAAANRDQALAEAEGIEAMLAAKNVISNANLVAQVITALWPELAPQLQALAPQPGVIGDAKIYTFANGGTTPDLNQLLLSTSGLTLDQCPV